MPCNRTLEVLALVTLLLVVRPACALITVGGGNCDQSTIQKAIEKIEADYKKFGTADCCIGVVGNKEYHENLFVSGSGIANGALSISIKGGKVDSQDGTCTLTDPDDGRVSIINGDGNGNSVIEIAGTANVSLINLTLTNGTGVVRGGGINFHGAGELHLTDVDVNGNSGADGGGISAIGFTGGSAGPANVFLHEGTKIEHNTADDGAGISTTNGRLFALEPNVKIVDNTAANAGGGIFGESQAQIDIGSVEISGNSAVSGGGIDVYGSSRLRIFESQAGTPALLSNNFASSAGGAIWANSSVCAAGLTLVGNSAPYGAAIYSSHDVDLRFGSLESTLCGPEPASQIGSVGCQLGSPCNIARDNRAEDKSGNPTSGAIFEVTGTSVFTANRLDVRSNHGGHVFRGGPGGQAHLFNTCVVADNETTDDLFELDPSGTLLVDNCTVVNNTIFPGNVFTNVTKLDRAIVWQTSNAIMAPIAVAGQVVDTIANDVSTLNGDASVVSADPLCVSPSTGNYHLQPCAPAVDYADSAGANRIDNEGFPRVDLNKPNRTSGHFTDLGAYELQSYSYPPCWRQDTLFCYPFENP